MKKKCWLPNQYSQPIHKCSFILRLWRVDESNTADWRASLEIPETGKRIGFASLEQLFAFLMDLSECNGEKQQIEDKAKEDSNE